MRGHIEKCGMPSPPERIIATGGASANHVILNTMASIFGCNVYTVQRPGITICFCRVEDGYTLKGVILLSLNRFGFARSCITGSSWLGVS